MCRYLTIWYTGAEEGTTTSTGISGIDYEALKARVQVSGRVRPRISNLACALYIRKSDPRQRSEETQKDDMLEYVEEVLHLPVYRDGEFEAIFEEAKSGLIVDRPKYQALKALARSGKISHIVLWIPSRWGRNTVEFITAFSELDALGVEIHMADRLPEQHRLTWDTVDEEAYKAKQEAITISKRVTPAMRRRARKGEVMQPRPIGYKRAGPHGDVESGVTQKDEKMAPLVEELFRRYVEDEESIWSLTKWWNGATGQHKRPYGVKKLLANPFYCGANIHGRTSHSRVRNDMGAKPREEWALGTHSCPIISVEMWNRAQDRLAGNVNRGQHRDAEPRYPLTGLLLCAQDGKHLHGQPVTYRREGQPAKHYHNYHCAYCGKTRSGKVVEQALRALLEAIPLGAERIAAESAAVAQQGGRPELEEIEQQLVRLQARRAKLMVKWADAATPDEEQAVQDAIALTDRELADLRTRQAAGKREQVADVTVARTAQWLASLGSWAELLDGANAAERNETYRHLVSELTLDLGAGTISVAWLPAIARLVGHEVQVASLKGRRSAPAKLAG
jgi:DNA invertase Pin-like site-specific DNA recombinase